MDQLNLETINQQARKAKELFNEGKHDEAETMMEGVMKQALEYFKDELSLEMAEFYYMYGTILVLKLSEQQDVFGQRTREAENNALGEETEISEEEQQIEQINDGDIEEEHKVQENKPTENVEDLDDFKIAWENLEVARVILEKQVEKQQQEQFEDFKYIRNLAKVLIKLSELDQWRDKFDEAQENLQKALVLRIKCENAETSRDVAETYFFLGNVTLYNYKEGKEEEALNFYLKALQILENHLSMITNTERKIIVLQEQYQKDHLQLSFLDNDDLKELKQVTSMVYDKVEDTYIALKEIQTEEWKKARDEMLVKLQGKQNEQQQQFTQLPAIQEERQIIQLGNFGNARRRVEVIDHSQKQQQPQQQLDQVNEKKQEQEEEVQEDPTKKVKID